MQKVPYMAVIGQREAESDSLALRVRGAGKKQEVMAGGRVPRPGRRGGAEPGIVAVTATGPRPPFHPSDRGYLAHGSYLEDFVSDATTPSHSVGRPHPDRQISRRPVQLHRAPARGHGHPRGGRPRQGGSRRGRGSDHGAGGAGRLGSGARAPGPDPRRTSARHSRPHHQQGLRLRPQGRDARRPRRSRPATPTASSPAGRSPCPARRTTCTACGAGSRPATRRWWTA